MNKYRAERLYLELVAFRRQNPVALGVKGGFFRTDLKDNAIVYWVESRLNDRTKKRCGDRFALKTYLSRWGYPLPEEDPTHFARNIRDLDKRLNAHYAGVQWQIGDAPATVGDISRRNWDKVFVRLGKRVEKYLGKEGGIQ